MPNSTALLLSELNALLRLTNTEAVIAQGRRAQASNDRFESELAENASKCEERSRLLIKTIRDLGGVPDVVGATAGRAAATTRLSADQGLPLTEGLFGDLALEHQLLDRTRFARMIAEDVGEKKALPVLQRLEVAHTATIDWIMTRLGEVAVGGPVALRPTPVQTVVGVTRRLASFPARSAAGRANRAVAAVGDMRQRAGEAVSENVDRARQLLEATGGIWSAGRDAALERTEEEARGRGARSTAATVNRTRRDLGAVDADELPIRGYDGMNAPTAIRRIERLSDAQDVRTMLAYETANKARKGVMAAAQQRLDAVASRLVAVS